MKLERMLRDRVLLVKLFWIILWVSIAIMLLGYFFIVKDLLA